MKLHSLIAAGTIALALVCYAQQPGQGKVLKSKDGTLAIYYQRAKSASVAVWLKENGDIEFKAGGTRLNGLSKDQGLTFSMNSLDGVASNTEDGPKRIKHVAASGKVVMDVVSDVEGSEMSSHLETELLTMDDKGTEAVINFTRPFLFTNTAKTAEGDRHLELRAPSGVFVLPPLGETSSDPNPFKSANVAGPVQVRVVSSRIAVDGVSRFDINVRADKMTFDAKDRVLRLTGNIVGDYIQKPVEGEEFGFEMEADQVLIYLDENSLVTDIKSIVGVVREKDGGGK